jgi:hypothetical protein
MHQYHIHIDGIHLDQELVQYLTLDLGFYADPFEHTMLIDGIDYAPDHLTLLIQETGKCTFVKSIYDKTKSALKKSNFIGHLQIELIAQKLSWPSQNGTKNNSSNLIKIEKFEKPLVYKTHELHLKVNSKSNPQVINDLNQTNIPALKINDNVYYTLSGSYQNVSHCFKNIKNYIDQCEITDSNSIQMEFETTVEHELFNMNHQQLPNTFVLA